MKRFLPIIAALAPALAALGLAIFSPGCAMTPTQEAASGTYLAGSAFATGELGKNPAVLKGLQDFAAALPLIPLGKVSPYQMGVINAELQPLVAAAASKPQYAQVFSQIGNFISAASQLSGNGLGSAAPTAEAGLAVAECTDFGNGITEGIQFWQGQQSVLGAPPPAK